MKRIALVSLLPVIGLACGGGATIAQPPPNCPSAPALVVAPAKLEPKPEAQNVDTVAQKVLAAMNAKDAGALEAMFDDAMKSAVPLERLTAMLSGLEDSKGKLLSTSRDPGGDDRSATYRFKAERGVWRVKLVLGRDDRIAGLSFSEPAAPPPPVAKSTLTLGLPFRGQWSVFWGGDTPEVNYHVVHESQRRATDLVVVDASGKTHKGEGTKNDDYFAWGLDVLAVADGTVLTAIDGVPENVPGVLNPLFALGNSVVVEHAGPVYSFYAHLRPGKVKVKAGAKVKRGDLLGACGNSGNTSEPHLHFQLQDGPLVDHSWGVEPIFKNVTVSRGGTSSVRPDYTWLKGDLVGEKKVPSAPR